jgi:2-keto-3-deoxy-L-rhamnonate aldolase RhmA
LEHGRYDFIQRQMHSQSSYVNHQMLPGTNHARAIARSGVDWVCVDTEHGNIAGMMLIRLVFVVV